MTYYAYKKVHARANENESRVSTRDAETFAHGRDTAKVEEIALDLIQNDLSQIEYYTDRMHNMVGRVLRKNG